MKRHGFTLAEILITLSIVAVAAAILTPAYVNMRPDKYKFKVLNQYKLLNDATEQLLLDHDIYYRMPIDSNTPPAAFDERGILVPTTDYGCKGLACRLMPTNATPYHSSQYINECKYPNLIREMLQLKTESTCAGGEYSGIAKDNTIWKFMYNGNYEYTVEIVFPNTSGTTCGPYSSSCKRPNVFHFYVNNMGDITGGDPLTDVYIKNMHTIYKSDDTNKISE